MDRNRPVPDSIGEQNIAGEHSAVGTAPPNSEPGGSGEVNVRASIRSQLLLLSLGMMAVAIIVISITAVSSAQSARNRAIDVSTQIIRQQAIDYLSQIARSSARENDLLLQQAVHDVQTVAASAAAIFNPTRPLPPGDFWPVEKHMTIGASGQYKNGLEDITSVFVPNIQTIDDRVIQDIELGGYLELILPGAFRNNPNAEAIYFATPREVTRYYPNIGLGDVVPPDFKVTGRVWFTGSTPQNNPRRAPWWTPVYADATGLGLVTTLAVPVYDEYQEFIGVVGLDMTLNAMRANVESTRFLESGYAFLIDAEGRAIALPEQGYQDILGRLPAAAGATAAEPNPDLTTSPTGFGPIIAKMRLGQSGFDTVTVQGQEIFVAYAPITSTGWSLASVAPAADTLQHISALQTELNAATRSILLVRVLPVSTVLFVILITIGLWYTNRLVEPIRKLAADAQKIGSGNWEIETFSARDDEIGLLSRTLARMAGQLRQTFASLEQRVVERTQQLEHRSLQIRTAAEIARDITASQEMDELLSHATRLIYERFNFYQVSIFLVDEFGEYAQVRASSGYIGQALIERNLKLRVGQEGIVGYVCAKGQARIAQNVDVDQVYYLEPLLAATRSEVGLPLKSGGKTLGVLDVQSNIEDAFDQEDVTILQTLADQLAIAIERISLIERLQASIKETSGFYENQVATNWRQAALSAAQNRASAFEWDRMHVAPLQKPLPQAVFERLEPGHPIIIPAGDGSTSDGHSQLVAPLLLRGQVIGVIGLEEDASHHWTTDEIAIIEAAANQVALTLENARLLEETQRRALREQWLGEVSKTLQAATSMEALLRITAEELNRTLGGASAFIRLGVVDTPGLSTPSQEDKP